MSVKVTSREAIASKKIEFGPEKGASIFFPRGKHTKEISSNFHVF